MGFDFSEVDHLAADLAAAPAKAHVGSVRAVASTTRSTQRDAQYFAPERTGFLHDNIVAESHGLHGRVISLADYSEYVEDGTDDTPAQPFMRPAAEVNVDRLADGVGDAGEDIL